MGHFHKLSICMPLRWIEMSEFVNKMMHLSVPTKAYMQCIKYNTSYSFTGQAMNSYKPSVESKNSCREAGFSSSCSYSYAW